MVAPCDSRKDDGSYARPNVQGEASQETTSPKIVLRHIEIIFRRFEMATLSSLTIGSVFDLIKFKLPDGSGLNQIVNGLAERDDFSSLVPAFAANQGLTNHTLRTISLPTGYLVDVGGSWKASKAEREPVIEALCTIKSAYQAPIDTFRYEDPALGKQLLKAEKLAHAMTINQQLTNLIIEGTTPNQSGLVGLMRRTPYMTYDNRFCFNVGGSGTDLRSCWLMKPGVDTLHMLYNKNHPTLGIEMDDKGEVRIDSLGTSNDEHRYDLCIEFMIQKGINVRDQRALKRICNVPCAVADLPGADLLNQIIEASIINAPTGGIMQVSAGGQVTELPAPWLLMCPERLYAKLVIEANNKVMVFDDDKNIYRTKLPRIGDNIIICRMDALNKSLGSGETAVAAA